MKQNAKTKSTSSSTGIRRARSNLRHNTDDLETDKESVISEYDDRQSQRSEEFSKSFTSSIRSQHSRRRQNSSTAGSTRSDDPFIYSLTGPLSSSALKKNQGGLLSSSRRMNNHNTSANRSFSSQSYYSQSSDVTSNQGDDSFCFSLKEFRQKENGMFEEDGCYDDLDGDEEEESLTPEERALMEKWMHVFQRMLKNRIKEEDAFEYLLEEELSLAQFGWNHSATILATISKIYSLKVDRLCSESYHLLASLARGSVKQKDEFNGDVEMKDVSAEKRRKNIGLDGSTIEQGSFEEFCVMCENGGDQKNIMKADKIGQLNGVDMVFDVDPLFRKTSSCFDSSSSNGLLLNILPLNSEVLLSLGEIEVEEQRPNRSMKREYADSNGSMWKKLRQAAAGMVEFDQKYELLPELVGFKMSLNLEKQQARELNVNQREESEVEVADLVDGDSKLYDRQLMEEIVVTMAHDPFRDVRGGSQTAIKNRNSGQFSASMQTPMNATRLQSHDNYGDFPLFNDDTSFSHHGSQESSNSSGFDSQSLNSSIHSLGKGDKQILSSVHMNLNWGDPKLWEMSKPSQQMIGRISKKQKARPQARNGLGAISEDVMEADDANDRHTLNTEFRTLTAQLLPRIIDFSIDLDNDEKYNTVMGVKKKAKTQKKKKINVRKIQQKNCIQKDHRITQERVFRIGLRNMKEGSGWGAERDFDRDGGFAGDMLDFLERDYQGESGQRLDEGYDLLDEQEEGNAINRRMSIRGGQSAMTPFNYSVDRLAASQRSDVGEQWTAMKPEREQFYSQIQTAQKRNVKIQELKETVWTCMTASKNSNSQYSQSQLQPLSQFTAQKSPRKRRSDSSSVSDNHQNSFMSFVLDQNNLEGSIKFTDVMTQLPSIYGGGSSLERQGVSIQNCFISLLHLANEKALRLLDPSHSEAEFFIFEDDQGGDENVLAK